MEELVFARTELHKVGTRRPSLPTGVRVCVCCVSTTPVLGKSTTASPRATDQLEHIACRWRILCQPRGGNVGLQEQALLQVLRVTLLRILHVSAGREEREREREFRLAKGERD